MWFFIDLFRKMKWDRNFFFCHSILCFFVSGGSILLRLDIIHFSLLLVSGCYVYRCLLVFFFFFAICLFLFYEIEMK